MSGWGVGMLGCLFMWFVSIVVLRLSITLLVVPGVMVGTKDTDYYDPDEAGQSGKERPHNDLLCHRRASLHSWNSHW